jgi:ribonuclease VapC
MVVDASAIVAILLREPGWDGLRDKLLGATPCVVPAPALLECQIALTWHRFESTAKVVAEFPRAFGCKVAAFTADDAALACQAFLAFGKGRHPAQLNFGDCMSYAVAKRMRLPLLFVGEDFALTDAVPA